MEPLTAAPAFDPLATPGKVFITGATGQTGSATINYLFKNFPLVSIMAGVRDAKRARDKFPNILRNLEFALVDTNLVGNRVALEELTRSMRGCDAALIVPPVEQRVEVSKAYVDCARAAGVRFLCLISTACVTQRNILFTRQLLEIEGHLRATGIPHAILRCEMFADNHLADAAAIKRDHAFYYPAAPDVRFDPVATADVGAVAATVMVRNLRSDWILPHYGFGAVQQQPQQQMVSERVTTTIVTADSQVHQVQETKMVPESQPGGSISTLGAGPASTPPAGETILHLTGPKAYSMTELANIYSKITLTDVKYVQVNCQDAINYMSGLGMPKWQAEGVCELWDIVNAGLCQNPSNDVERVLGRKGLSVEDFISGNSSLFKPSF